MPYSAEIYRANPGCILFLVDQSSLMRHPFGLQPTKRKVVGVADAVNNLLHTLCIRCAQANGIRDIFRIGIIGYGQTVESGLSGGLAGRGLVSIQDIEANPLRLELRRQKFFDDDKGEVIELELKFPVWIEAVAAGETPMNAALELAREWIMPFLSSYRDCFPPLIINLSDGAADEDPTQAAASLTRLGSTDGGVLLFNAQISEKNLPPILYPEQESGLPNDHAKQLFRMSSPLPRQFVEVARRENIPVGPRSRGFSFNFDLDMLLKFLDLGNSGPRKI